jgi:pimeloyl-ACP methyl ester carboxylesterase
MITYCTEPGRLERWEGAGPGKERNARHLDLTAPHGYPKLLFIAGEKDHIMPPSVNKSNARHYKDSPALTEYFEFEGRDHWTCAAPGWEAVADYALEWAEKHARTTART